MGTHILLETMYIMIGFNLSPANTSNFTQTISGNITGRRIYRYIEIHC